MGSDRLLALRILLTLFTLFALLYAATDKPAPPYVTPAYCVVPEDADQELFATSNKDSLFFAPCSKLKIERDV